MPAVCLLKDRLGIRGFVGDHKLHDLLEAHPFHAVGEVKLNAATYLLHDL